LLVAAGFALLAVHVARRRSLNWLVLANLIATFALLYIMQFFDAAGFVARYNVARRKENRARTLGLAYSKSIGPSAWPALADAARQQPRSESYDARDALAEARRASALYLESLRWRSWQQRHVQRAREVLNEPLP